MGFPVASAFYRHTELCTYTSRPKGRNLYGATNKVSFCAEYRLYTKLANIYPDFIKKKGKKLLIVVDINGDCSKPCRNCQRFLSEKLPFCKIKFKENGKFIETNPKFIDSRYSKGVRRNQY